MKNKPISMNAKQVSQNINKIVYTNNHNKQLATDIVIAEQPLQISLSWQEKGLDTTKVFAITMRTPGDDEQLILGLLLSEGIIQSINDINSISTEENEETTEHNLWEVKLSSEITPNIASLERFQITYSSCGLCGTTSLKSLELKNPPILNDEHDWLPITHIYAFPEIMRQHQLLFEKTGGVHTAALFDEQGKLIIIKEDIGRHNALDKLVGTILQQSSSNLTHQAIVISSRISFEMIQKTVMVGVPVLIAIGAPSDLAIKAAKRFNLTLIGFANRHSFNVYHGDWRLRQE